MTSVVVRNEAGRRYDRLAERFKTIADETLPLVESITELPLPPVVTIRLMAPRAMRKSHTRRRRRLWWSEALELGASAADMRQGLAVIKAHTKNDRQTWFLIGAQSVLFTPGQPEIAVIPRALWEGGVLNDERFHYTTVAHEATHLAQYTATQGKAWADMDTLFPHLRGIADRDYRFLLEGHAYWADSQITAKLLGPPEDSTWPSPHASLRFKTLATASRKSQGGSYREHTAPSVEAIVDEYGLARFNTVWERLPELVPTRAETQRPAEWANRFRAVAAR
ncbi:hypothetical protein ACIPX0_49940 [Streptomyces sp. NPDC090075]|uniref:hypothetical protein n=1 Tax=Streptomyces sp. NPDC090075 TaxID=3365937 RepID=UPI0037FB284E